MPDFDELPEEPAIHEFWKSAACAFSALVIGCTLLLSACTLMVFNVILFRGGFAGLPRELVRTAGTVGVIGVALLGVVGLAGAVRAMMASRGGRGSMAFAFAGMAASFVGSVAWVIAGGDLLIILGIFS